MNPHHPDLESGALSVRATGLYLILEPLSSIPSLSNLLRLFMNRVPMTETAEFLEFQLVWGIFLVLHGRIISSFAL